MKISRYANYVRQLQSCARTNLTHIANYHANRVIRASSKQQRNSVCKHTLQEQTPRACNFTSNNFNTVNLLVFNVLYTIACYRLCQSKKFHLLRSDRWVELFSSAWSLKKDGYLIMHQPRTNPRICTIHEIALSLSWKNSLLKGLKEAYRRQISKRPHTQNSSDRIQSE